MADPILDADEADIFIAMLEIDPAAAQLVEIATAQLIEAIDLLLLVYGHAAIPLIAANATVRARHLHLT